MKVIFPIIDVVYSLMMIITLIVRCVHGNEKEADISYYDVIMKIVTVSNAVIALMFLILGMLIFWKLKSYYSFCSKSVLSFILVSSLFVVLTVTRFVSLIYKDITGKWIQP